MNNRNIDRSIDFFPSLYKYWGTHDYYTDHHKILLEREKKRHKFFYKSPQLGFRSSLLTWIKKIALLKKLDITSVHLAVYLLDVFMDNHKIRTDRLYLVAYSCLLLATKFEEGDAKCLKNDDMNLILGEKYSSVEYFSLEVVVFKHFNWSLFKPTAVQFVNYYIGYLLCEDDSKEEKENESDLWRKGKDIVHSYLDCILIDIYLMQTKPSTVGAAIIAATRKEMELSPIWPSQLSTITEHSLSDLCDTMLKLNIVWKIVQ